MHANEQPFQNDINVMENFKPGECMKKMFYSVNDTGDSLARSTIFQELEVCEQAVRRPLLKTVRTTHIHEQRKHLIHLSSHALNIFNSMHTINTAQ